MPILKIEIDGQELEFKIKPINKKIYKQIITKHMNFNTYFLDRPGLVAHIVKEPKMNRSEWGDMPTSILTRIVRSFEHYVESIEKENVLLRQNSVLINVLDNELDDLYCFADSSDEDDWIWDAIKYRRERRDSLLEMNKEIERKLSLIKEDKVIFDEKGVISYDVQPLQLGDRK